MSWLLLVVLDNNIHRNYMIQGILVVPHRIMIGDIVVDIQCPQSNDNTKVRSNHQEIQILNLLHPRTLLHMDLLLLVLMLLSHV